MRKGVCDVPNYPTPHTHTKRKAALNERLRSNIPIHVKRATS